MVATWFGRLAIPIIAVLVSCLVAPSPARAQYRPTDLAYQLQVRANLGLSIDPTFVGDVAASQMSDTRSLGIPVTLAEIANLRGRPDSKDVAPIEAFGLDHPSVFGGVYIDQRAGGVVDVAFTQDEDANAAIVSNLVSGSFELRFRTVTWSEKQLIATVSAITGLIPDLERAGIEVEEVVPNIVDNGVDVSVSTDVGAAATSLGALFGPIVTVASGVHPTQPATCTRANCPPPWRGGLSIGSTNMACTSGFIAKTSGGGSWYMITAGHCDSDGLNINWSNGAGFIGSVTRTAFHDYSSADALAIRIADAKRSNYFFIASTVPAQPIVGWASYSVGEIICKSGLNTGESCGAIDAKGVTTHYDGVHFVDQVRASEAVLGGDSGAPVFDWNDNRILIGTVTALDSEFVTYYSSILDEMPDLTIVPCLSLSC